uniref:Uncharacterized protein n=1 Tax=Panagrolaimus sp. ES5 TaxID=591445 RepID=A0AC34GEQ5_9BILA
MVSDSSQDETDTFKVYSNGKIVMNIKIDYFKIVATDYKIYLNSSNLNTLEVQTFPSKIRKELYLLTLPKSIPPVFSHVEITELNKFTVIDTGLYELGAVKVTVTKVRLFVKYQNFNEYF